MVTHFKISLRHKILHDINQGIGDSDERLRKGK